MRLDRRSEAKVYTRIPTARERALIEQHEAERFRWTVFALSCWVLAMILLTTVI